MGMLQNVNPPNLPVPVPGKEVDATYVNNLLNVLRLFFQQINAVQQLTIANVNINIDTLPTEANLSSLRSGDVYRYTADNSLRIKV